MSPASAITLKPACRMNPLLLLNAHPPDLTPLESFLAVLLCKSRASVHAQRKTLSATAFVNSMSRRHELYGCKDNRRDLRLAA
jgi:hypothetical protein